MSAPGPLIEIAPVRPLDGPQQVSLGGGVVGLPAEARWTRLNGRRPLLWVLCPTETGSTLAAYTYDRATDEPVQLVTNPTLRAAAYEKYFAHFEAE